MWSSASRRLPDSRRLNVERSMLARSATCWSVSPRSLRSSRSRRRTRASTGSSFACMAKKLGRSCAPVSACETMDTTWDCIVVGAGAAGLSAALVLGRARRRTLVVDAGAQSNLVAHGIGGLLGHDTRAPADFYAAGRREIAAYPTVQLRAGEVAGGERDGDGLRARARRRRARDGAPRAARHRHGLPPSRAAGHRGALGPLGLSLPVLPRVGGARPAAWRARARRRRASTARCCCAPGATT